ncbi:hypothetical protein [Paracoccus sp. R86501]|uniref:hypothetical protein n=1 Tax=Paracoccus sp. R86501 TaxID=3101711 RepID=UPI00366A92CC
MRALITVAVLSPSVAFAHQGDHSHSAPTHLLTEADHLIMLGLVATAGVVAWLWYRGRS